MLRHGNREPHALSAPLGAPLDALLDALLDAWPDAWLHTWLDALLVALLEALLGEWPRVLAPRAAPGLADRQSRRGDDVSAVLSVLDLSPIVEGGTVAQSFQNSLDLARHAERLGYHRFWLAEHHNIPSVGSAATAVLIAHVAGGTTTIRVGAGGVMLPNHSPLVVAEQFGTLESLYPGRIDLALGRAPGADQTTAQALRRSPQAGDLFPQDVLELMSYFRDDPENAVRAVPGAGLEIPLFILGSSLFGAQLAAHLGLPFAFASHFAPALLGQAIEIYRARFRPSDRLAKPYLILGANVVAADTDREARRLFTSYEQSFVNLRRGRPAPVPPPVDDYELPLTPIERAQLAPVLEMAIVGGPETIRRRLREFIATTGADEIMIASQFYEHGARVRSYEIAIEAHDGPRT